jgi:hypothetical protein
MIFITETYVHIPGWLQTGSGEEITGTLILIRNREEMVKLFTTECILNAILHYPATMRIATVEQDL